MNLAEYSETIQRQLIVAANASGDDATALAERLVAPLDAAIRLSIQEALAAAAEEITLELAPGSVELRVRGRDLEFAVVHPPSDGGDEPGADDLSAGIGGGLVAPATSSDDDDGSMQRINLRLPDHLKTRVEQAAGREALSVNAWLVRAAAAAVERTENAPRHTRRSQRYTGWAR